MRTTIRMDNSLAADAKQFAGRTGRSFTQLVEDSLRHFIAKPPVPAEDRVVILRHQGSLPVSLDEVDRMIRAAQDEDDFHIIAIGMGYQRVDYSGVVAAAQTTEED